VVILVNLLPRPLQKLCTVLYYVVTLGFFAFMVKYGVELTMQKFAFHEMATAIAVPMGAIMICVPLCGALGIIGTIQSFLEYPQKVEIGGEEKK
jgi:TRAP-type C4-dicarboxylate transport system permease small subunit